MKSIGILDPAGKKKNPLTEKPYSAAYKKLAKMWSNLPAYKKAKDVIKSIKQNQVLLITSNTGSGKTVLLPKYMLHALNYTGRIAVTLPKQIVTKNAADFAAKTLDVELGKEVGYQYRGAPRESRSGETKLLYATDGTIVAMILNDSLLKNFDAVIVDEAHERKVQIDFLLYLLKEVAKKRPEFKVVIMSATINVNIFKKYYEELKFKALHLSGETNYPIKSIFLEKKLEYPKILEAGYQILTSILEKDDPKKKGSHDIMFFITASSEAYTMCKRLSADIQAEKGKKCKLSCKGGIFCIEMYSSMIDQNKKLAQDKELYKKEGDYKRKVVITTNVAESSLTVDGIKYVIDSGHEFSDSYDAEHRARKLDRKLITHAQAKQRMGRAGRTEPGICYHLYTKEDFNKNMDRYPLPDIRKSNISSECLRLLNLDKISSVNELLNIFMQFIEPPRETNVKAAINELTEIGAIENNKISETGRAMSRIGGSSPMAALALIFSKVYRCNNEMANIISMIDASRTNMGSIFIMPKTLVKLRGDTKEDKERYEKKLREVKIKFEKTRSQFKHKLGDHLSLLNVFKKYSEMAEQLDEEKLKKWCKENFIKFYTLRRAKNYARRTARQLSRTNIEQTGLKQRPDIINLQVEDRIMASLVVAYRTNVGVHTGKETYKTKYSGKIRVTLNENSFITKKELPKNVVYTELFISMGSANINIVSQISNELIKILAA